MSQMKNLNQTLLLMDLIVDKDRGVDQPAHPRSSASGVPHAGEPTEQIHVIEQGLAKTGSGLAVVLGDLPHDPGQVV